MCEQLTISGKTTMAARWLDLLLEFLSLLAAFGSA